MGAGRPEIAQHLALTAENYVRARIVDEHVLAPPELAASAQSLGRSVRPRRAAAEGAEADGDALGYRRSGGRISYRTPDGEHDTVRLLLGCIALVFCVRVLLVDILRLI